MLQNYFISFKVSPRNIQAVYSSSIIAGSKWKIDYKIPSLNTKTKVKKKKKEGVKT